jgi:hypothetical protein
MLMKIIGQEKLLKLLKKLIIIIIFIDVVMDNN